MANTTIVFSGSTNGRVIPVVQTVTPGTLIHTSGGTDAVYLWAANVIDEDANLTIEWGGVLNTGDHIFKRTIIRAHAEPRLVIAGQVLTGGLIVRAFGSVASAINISGFVTRRS